jgi:hypothetical protein
MISEANLTFDQSKYLHHRIQNMLKKLNSNKITSLRKLYFYNQKRKMQTSIRLRRNIKIPDVPKKTPIDHSVGRPVFTPNSPIRMFSPQPWRLFSPIHRRVVPKKKYLSFYF